MSSRSAVVVAVLAAAAGVGVLLAPASSFEPDSSQVTTDEVATAEGPALLSVHVSGWVLEPGVIRVGAGSLVADVIAAAGGALPGARLDQVNLASPVADGGQIDVPGPDVAGSQGPAEDGLVSLNAADAAELQALPGVGPVLADRIVAYREANGPFSVVEDLLEVAGIGEAKLAAIRDLVTVP